jgi:deazaflavin-dependent oxidoreductase (nitroreductase family)
VAETSPPLIRRLFSSRAGGWYFLNVANRIDKRLIPATNGRLSTAPGSPVLVIETIGAKSGKPRRIPLAYVTDGDDLVLIASKAGAPKHPAWYHNLRKNPRLKVWAPRGRSGEYIARTVQDPAERERLFKKAVDMYHGYAVYQERAGGREIPVVVLSRKSGG